MTVPVPDRQDAERPGEPERIDRILDALAAFHAFHAPRVADMLRRGRCPPAISRRRRDGRRFRQLMLFE